MEANNNQKTLFLLGGYTDRSLMAHFPKGSDGSGIYSTLFDPQTKKFTQSKTSKVTENPAFIMKHPTLDIVYMTTEVITIDSEILTATLDRSTGEVKVIDRKTIKGKSTCHVEWDYSNNYLIAVSYWDSKLTTFQVDQQGRLSEIVDLFQPTAATKFFKENNPTREDHQKGRQDWPHFHQIRRNLFTKNQELFFVPDLGQDQIQILQIEKGKVNHIGRVQLPKKAGPRHIEFNLEKGVLYAGNELNNTISTFKYKEKQIPANKFLEDDSSNTDSMLVFIHNISTLNEQVKSHCAEIRLHPSNKFVYIGNRGHNSISIFKVLNDGSLQLIEVKNSGGIYPRHFNFDLTNRFLICSNHSSDNLIAFEIDLNTGLLTQVDQLDHISSVVWITPVVPIQSQQQENQNSSIKQLNTDTEQNNFLQKAVLGLGVLALSFFVFKRFFKK